MTDLQPCARCLVAHDPRFTLCQRASVLSASAAVLEWQRINHRSLAYRAACAYFSVPLRQRRVSDASAYVQALPRLYTLQVADARASGLLGTSTVTPAAWQPFASMVLEACRMLRRWRWHASSTPATPLIPGSVPLDGCLCRVCLSR